jgi:Icc-related predicted phosphoesterase
MLVLGDAHADEKARREALLAAYEASDADVAFQAGDLFYYDLPAPTWFVAGNNEDFDVIAALRADEDRPDVANAHLIASEVIERAGLRIAGLSGNFSPTRFEMARTQLSGERRRHFLREEIERAKSLDAVDVFLTHEAPHGLAVEEDYDVGCKHVDAILQALEPDLCLVGHHHSHVEGSFGPTTVVSLAPAWEAYYELDPASLALQQYPAPTA